MERNSGDIVFGLECSYSQEHADQLWFPSDYFNYDKADDAELLKLAQYKEMA
jgi:hypothetical protein